MDKIFHQFYPVENLSNILEHQNLFIHHRIALSTPDKSYPTFWSTTVNSFGVFFMSVFYKWNEKLFGKNNLFYKIIIGFVILGIALSVAGEYIIIKFKYYQI